MGIISFIIIMLISSLSYSQIDEIKPSISFIKEAPVVANTVIKNKNSNIPYYMIIKDNSDKYNLPLSLVLSVIKNESSFDPWARSEDNAIGLMQIVPKYAGKEAWKHIYGYSWVPTDSILYIPSFNIQLGCAYLWLLINNYFNGIINSESRIYCTISAYNTGPSNTARAFISDYDIQRNLGYAKYYDLKEYQIDSVRLDMSINKINNMSSNQVQRTLKYSLPYNETIIYLERVLETIEKYENI